MSSEDDVFSEVLITKTENDEEVITINGTAIAGKGKSYKVTIDREKGVYDVEEYEGSDVFSIEPLALTEITGTVKVTTIDPINIPVCYTKLLLTWYDSESAVRYRTSSLDTWAANPTPWPFNNHWYENGNTLAPYQYDTYQKLFQGATANFYNYDFGDTNLITTVKHELVIKATAGSPAGYYDYSVHQTLNGEYKDFLTMIVDAY